MQINKSKPTNPDHFASMIENMRHPDGHRIHWDWFCTWTTGYRLTLLSARRCMNRFYESLYFEAPNTSLIWVAEPFDLKEGFHLHGLLSTGLGFNAVKEIWHVASAGKKYGKNNRSQLRPFKPEHGASHYIGKYIGKKLSDYDVRTNLTPDTTIDKPEGNAYTKPENKFNSDSIEAYLNKQEYSPPIILPKK